MMKPKLALSLLGVIISTSAFANDWSVIDSQTANCGAVLTTNLNVKTGQKVLSIQNQGCSKIKIDTLGLKRDEPLRGGAMSTLDITTFSGDKLPVQVNQQFLVLGNCAQGALANAQNEEQRRLTQLMIQQLYGTLVNSWNRHNFMAAFLACHFHNLNSANAVGLVNLVEWVTSSVQARRMRLCLLIFRLLFLA